MKKYRSNFCTFLGKRCNVEILHAYIEKALELSIIDRYFIIDMTKEFSDHEFLKQEHHRLSKKFNKRVFLRNSEKQYLKLEKERHPNDVDWGAFYKIFSEFTDEDVVIKCDDDILYIDIERLGAAIELRHLNPQPLIMHANCINNGVCSYHQYHNNIWRLKSDLIKRYPSGGLSGPLFIDEGRSAKRMHDQFLEDMLKNQDNIKKYQLNKNIHFTQRISINFVLFSGRDREVLSNISDQDEYLVSSKIPQQQDRPNLIIGDLVVSHFSYRSQNSLRQHSREGYARLTDLALNRKIKNKTICTTINKTTTIKNKSGEYLKANETKEKHYIKNIKHDCYMSIGFNKIEKFVDDPDLGRIGTGTFSLSNLVTGSKNPHTAFSIEEGNLCNGSIMAKSYPDNLSTEQYTMRFINKFHEYAFERNKVNIKSFSSPTHITDRHGRYLVCSNQKDGSKIIYFQKVKDKNIKRHAQKWLIETIPENKTSKVKILRCTENLENDGTFATGDGFQIKNGRGFFWTLKNYIWEIVPSKKLFSSLRNIFYIKVINDEEKERFLSIKNKELILRKEPHDWTIKNNCILDKKTGLDIKLNTNL